MREEFKSWISDSLRGDNIEVIQDYDHERGSLYSIYYNSRYYKYYILTKTSKTSDCGYIGCQYIPIDEMEKSSSWNNLIDGEFSRETFDKIILNILELETGMTMEYSPCCGLCGYRVQIINRTGRCTRCEHLYEFFKRRKNNGRKESKNIFK